MNTKFVIFVVLICCCGLSLVILAAFLWRKYTSYANVMECDTNIIQNQQVLQVMYFAHIQGIRMYLQDKMGQIPHFSGTRRKPKNVVTMLMCSWYLALNINEKYIIVYMMSLFWQLTLYCSQTLLPRLGIENRLF